MKIFGLAEDKEAISGFFEDFINLLEEKDPEKLHNKAGEIYKVLFEYDNLLHTKAGEVSIGFAHFLELRAIFEATKLRTQTPDPANVKLK